MRIIWELLERADLGVMRAMDQLDQRRGKPSAFERAKQATKDVRAPQRVIEFDK